VKMIYFIECKTLNWKKQERKNVLRKAKKVEIKFNNK